MSDIYKDENLSYPVRNLFLNLITIPKAVDKPVRATVMNKWKRVSKETFSISDIIQSRILSSLPNNDFAPLLPHLVESACECYSATNCAETDTQVRYLNRKPKLRSVK